MPTIRHLTRRVNREVALMHVAPLHRQRVTGAGLAATEIVLGDPASLTVGTLQYRHRSPLAGFLHVRRTHEGTRQSDLDLRPRLVGHFECTPRGLPTRRTLRPCPEPTVESRSRWTAVGFALSHQAVTPGPAQGLHPNHFSASQGGTRDRPPCQWARNVTAWGSWPSTWRPRARPRRSPRPGVELRAGRGA